MKRFVFSRAAFGGWALLLSATAFAERIELKTDAARCLVETQGARILSFKVGDDELLWNADPVQTTDRVWAHGGIPIAWPWFGRARPESDDDIHGFAWKRPFEVRSRREGAHAAELVLVLRTDAAELEYVITLKDDLRLDLTTRNISNRPFRFSAAFHPYFAVGERDRAWVSGAAPEPFAVTRSIDDVFPAPKGSCAFWRLVDRALGRTIQVVGENATGVNVWNPGPEKDCPGFVPGDTWRRFVCVEPTASGDGKVIALAPGEVHSLKMGVMRIGSAALTGFAGRDARYPDAAEKAFSLPFKVMFIGAHPDDAEYDFGAAAAKFVRAGAKVTFVSVCNGDNGHQTMSPEALARRRYGETQASARHYGIERYIVMGEHDCRVEPTVDLRQRVTRLIRALAPNMVVTHRTCDYHADHRAAGQVVQDATYLMGVPLFAPEMPVPEMLPFVAYAGDQFEMPRPFRPDLVVDGEDEFETVVRALDCHVSQLYEWLAPEYGVDPRTIPADAEGRLQYVRRYAAPDLRRDGMQHRALVTRLFGGDAVRLVNVFEICPYARAPSKKERDFLSAIPGFKWVRE